MGTRRGRSTRLKHEGVRQARVSRANRSDNKQGDAVQMHRFPLWSACTGVHLLILEKAEKLHSVRKKAEKMHVHTKRLRSCTQSLERLT